jgi:hypothetical protein
VSQRECCVDCLPETAMGANGAGVGWVLRWCGDSAKHLRQLRRLLPGWLVGWVGGRYRCSLGAVAAARTERLEVPRPAYRILKIKIGSGSTAC